MKPAVLIVVTHLLGAGHLTRAAALGRALARAGHPVTLVSGGMPNALIDAHGMRFVQLPPVRAVDEDFRALADERCDPVGESLLAERRGRLLAAFADAKPDILVTELYPFGRRVLAAEFDALLDAARAMEPTPLVVASIRDILVAPSRPEKIARAHAIVFERYDAVLVHGDPDLVPLRRSWPVSDDLAPRLHYTGFIDADEPTGVPAETIDILVSGGSSDAALPLYRAALAAASLLPVRRVHLLVGRSVADVAFHELEGAAPPNTRVERARADFRALLAGARLFVGLSGYNTAVDLFATGTPAILVPFERGGETEQRVRAEYMAIARLATVLPDAELSAATLAAAIREAEAKRPLSPPALRPRLDGAAESVRILKRLHARRAAEERQVPRTPALLRPALAAPLAQAITADLDRLADRGTALRVWWRDDDAAAPSDDLDRLLTLASHAGIPLAVAAVPALAVSDLAARLADEAGVRVLVHGWRHANHEPEGAKSSEFGVSRPIEAAMRDAKMALSRAATTFGTRLLPVFVPPWNRLAPALTARLADLGYGGLSCFGEPVRREQGLLRLDTHIDPIAWRGGRDLADEAALLAQWRRAVSFGGADEAIVGLLSHHRVTTERVWAFMNDLVALLANYSAVEIPPLAKLWSTGPNRTNTAQANDAECSEDIVAQAVLG